ncbi:MAG: hypothetical protein IJS99_10580 [Synergistaceae bacterium]|nr:hypothetical protein [Synergistaceae bacterium]
MLMGLHDVVRLGRTPEEREELKKSLIKLLFEQRKDEDIDLSDMPEVTDFSRYKPLKPHIDKIREHNLRIKAERERKKLENFNQ